MLHCLLKIKKKKGVRNVAVICIHIKKTLNWFLFHFGVDFLLHFGFIVRIAFKRIKQLEAKKNLSQTKRIKSFSLYVQWLYSHNTNDFSFSLYFCLRFIEIKKYTVSNPNSKGFCSTVLLKLFHFSLWSLYGWHADKWFEWLIDFELFLYTCVCVLWIKR